jgi:hypothetical protein
MEGLENGKKTATNFFNHVFNFDENSKGDVFNIIQYSMLSIVPVVILNKTMQKYVPEADDHKGSVEILAEIVVQIVGMFLGILLIHRINTYIPTYSGVEYPVFNIIFIILAVLLILLSLQTKLGEKVSILFDRVTELWEGKKKPVPNNSKPNNPVINVSQPISQGILNNQQYSNNMGSQPSFSDGTDISQLPIVQGNQPSQDMVQKLPNYDNMYKQQPNQPQNAPGDNQSSGIMAASDALGGGFGSFGAW